MITDLLTASGAGGSAPAVEATPCTGSLSDDAGDPLRPADAADEERWVVLYTYSRREKRVAHACDYLGVRHYLPLYVRHGGGLRRHTSQLPLFPGYVFACVSYQTRIELLHTGSVVRVIQVLHPGILLAELRSIRAALTASVDLVHGRALTRGDRVRVLCGPLEDVEGVILRRRRRRQRERLILNVSILGKSVATEIDLHDVERVGPPRFSDGGLRLQ